MGENEIKVHYIQDKDKQLGLYPDVLPQMLALALGLWLFLAGALHSLLP
jgi:hypothetical protein